MTDKERIKEADGNDKPDVKVGEEIKLIIIKEE